MTHSYSDSDRHAAISDLAVFQSKRLGAPIDRAKGEVIRQTLKGVAPYLTFGNQTLYPVQVGGKEVVLALGPQGRIEAVRPAHPKGIATSQALSYATTRLGLTLTNDDYKAIYDLVENATDRKDEGCHRVSATVTYEGDDYEVVIGLKDRMILRINKTVLRFATAHAIKRAKERYGLILNSTTAQEILKKLQTGDYVRCEAGRTVRNPLDMGNHEKAHHIRATVNYDCEDFTVIYDPHTETIVTVTPPGDFDPARKRAGA